MKNRSSKGLSEQALQRLEETGYLKSLRAEMKAEVMNTLVKMEENDELPSHLRIKRYTPPSDEYVNCLAYIAEFMKFHGLKHSLECLKAEVNGEIPVIRGNDSQSELASCIAQYNSSGKGPNPILE